MTSIISDDQEWHSLCWNPHYLLILSQWAIVENISCEVVVSAPFYYTLRILLHKNRWVLRITQIVRGWWMLGPFRGYAIRYYQRRNHVRPLQVERHDLFPKFDVGPVVDSLNKKGYANGWKIPEEYVVRIVQYTKDTKFLRYWNPHRECEAIDQIARNEKLVEIARQYLGAEPILWLTQLKWSFGVNASKEQQGLLSSGKAPVQYDGDAFHYDTLDFKSLTIFIYLTDVDVSCGPHVLIENTHATKSFGDICRIVLNDTVAQQKFGDRIKMILGTKGAMLFEETSAFHKASRCQNKRLMLSIDYVLQRSPPPEHPILV